jgi:hypothetical protein
MKPGPTGMVLDRALTPTLLDVALRVATESGESRDARRLLTVALRDHISAQESEGKTKGNWSGVDDGLSRDQSGC